MPRTLEAIKKDFHSYKALTRGQRGITLYAEKYVEDIGVLLKEIDPKHLTPEVAKDEVAKETETRKSKEAKAPKT